MDKKEKQELLEQWTDLDYEESHDAFRQTFGYDYGGTINSQLSKMDRDVKKANISELRELIRHAGGTVKLEKVS